MKKKKKIKFRTFENVIWGSSKKGNFATFVKFSTEHHLAIYAFFQSV